LRGLELVSLIEVEREAVKWKVKVDLTAIIRGIGVNERCT